MIRFNHEERQVGRRRADLSASPSESTATCAYVLALGDAAETFEGELQEPPSGRVAALTVLGAFPFCQTVTASPVESTAT